MLFSLFSCCLGFGECHASSTQLLLFNLYRCKQSSITVRPFLLFRDCTLGYECSVIYFGVRDTLRVVIAWTIKAAYILRSRRSVQEKQKQGDRRITMYGMSARICVSSRTCKTSQDNSARSRKRPKNKYKKRKRLGTKMYGTRKK